MNVFAIGTDNRPDEQEQLQNRIKAKASLWTFFEEILPEILNTTHTPEELTKEITGAAARILHPHFSASEMPEEVGNVLQAFKTQRPKNFLNLVTDDTLQKIMDKLK